MTEHEKFNELMILLGLSKKELAKRLSMGYKSVLNQTEPGKTSPKKLARWAKAMMLTKDILEDKKGGLPSDDMIVVEAIQSARNVYPDAGPMPDNSKIKMFCLGAKWMRDLQI